MNRALLFIFNDAHFVELSRVAPVLRNEGGYQPVFMFTYRYPALDRDLAWCRLERYEFIDGAGGRLGIEPEASRAELPDDLGLESATALPGLLVRLRHRLVPVELRAAAISMRAAWRGASVRQFFLSLVYPQLGMYLSHFRSQAALIRSIVERISPKIVVLPEDNVGYVTGHLIREAHRLHVPSVIIPYTIANAQEIAEAYWHNPDYSLDRWRNWLAGKLFPKWVHEHRGRKLLPFPPAEIAAIELLGMAPPLPWIINSGDADAIAVEGPFMRRYYEAAGLPREKLVVTGAIYDDILFRQMAMAGAQPTRLREELGLDPLKPVLLCALPPDQYRSARPGAEFASYEELVRGWARVLADARQFNVLVRLHPRTLPEEVPYLGPEYGLTVTDRDTASLIPHCDLYVASVSATIRMAIAAGKPVVNYDCYRFRYRDFNDIPGVVTVDGREAFVRQVRDLSDPKVRQAMAAKQRAFAAGANLLDGRAHERILTLVNALAAGST